MANKFFTVHNGLVVGPATIDATTGNIATNSTTTSNSTTTGALIVAGGAGIGGNLYVGGEIVAQKLTIQLTTVTTTLIETDDIIRTVNTTQSTSTTTGALQVSGGAGIGGNLYVGGTIFGTVNASVNTATNANNIATVQRTTNAIHYLTFVSDNNATSAYEPVYTTSSFVINPANGNVGVGTASPNQKLYVANTGATYMLVQSSDNNGDAGLKFAGAGDRGSIYGTAGYDIYIEPNAQFGQADVIINSKNGSTMNVGIGTTNPGNQLDVLNTSTYKGITVRGNAAPSVVFDSSNSAIDWKIGNSGANANNFAISTGSAIAGELLVISSTGNVGIGTTTPTSLLHVAGNTLITGITTVTNTTQSTSTATGALQVAGGVGIAGNLWVGGTINANIQGTISTATLANTVLVGQRTTNATHYLTFVDSNDVTPTADSLYTTSSFVVNPSTGNVGISTSSPTTTLDVNGDVTIADKIIHSGDTNTAIRFPAADTFTVETNGSERTRVTSAGNVGIGTSSPAHRLSVFGNTPTEATISINRAADDNDTSYLNFKRARGTVVSSVTATQAGDVLGTILWQAANGTNINTIAARIDSIQETSAASSGVLRFATGGNTERMRIDSNGNVGIGITSPTSKLHVSGDARITGITTVTNTTAASSTVTGALIVNGGIGVGNNVYIAGSLFATTKSFLIDHPTKPGKKLRYGSLEGPENGVYVRGRTQDTVIELPEYWTKLVDPESITVTLTPIGRSRMPSINRVENNRIYLNRPWFGQIDCYYIVFGERNDIEKLEPEI